MRPNVRGLFVKLYMLMAAMAYGIAGAFMLGSEARFSGPSFTAQRALVEWSSIAPHLLWGAVFLAYGLVLIVALGRPLAVHALRAGVALYLFLAISFGSSVVADPRAAASGMASYFVIAIVHLVLQDHLTNRGWERC